MVHRRHTQLTQVIFLVSFSLPEQARGVNCECDLCSSCTTIMYAPLRTVCVLDIYFSKSVETPSLPLAFADSIGGTQIALVPQVLEDSRHGASPALCHRMQMRYQKYRMWHLGQPITWRIRYESLWRPWRMRSAGSVRRQSVLSSLRFNAHASIV